MAIKTFGTMAVDWEQRIAAMPDNAPPKWMFNNVTAIRENTERILDLVGGAPSGGMRVGAAQEAERSRAAAELRELEVEHEYGVVTEAEFQTQEQRLHQ